jgi:hypothetical protein
MHRMLRQLLEFVKYIISWTTFVQVVRRNSSGWRKACDGARRWTAGHSVNTRRRRWVTTRGKGTTLRRKSVRKTCIGYWETRESIIRVDDVYSIGEVLIRT